MPLLFTVPKRAIALSQVLFLCLPLAALDHHHPSGHDETHEHVEADYGAHHTVPDQAAPRTSTAPTGLIAPAATSGEVRLPDPPVVVAPQPAASAEIRLARPPPDAKRSRGPPLHS